MNLTELKTLLAQAPGRNVRFVLPDGAPVPAHAHVTEVARIEKRFIDCGGVVHNDRFCRLQTWVAGDVGHRLSAGKLLGILEKAQPVLGGEALEVDIEHELEHVTQFPLAAVVDAGAELRLELGQRHTDCLAKDKCLPAAPASNPISFTAVRRSP